MDDPKLLAQTNVNVDRGLDRATTATEDFIPSTPAGKKSPLTEIGTWCFSRLRISLREQGFSDDSTEVILSSWRISTRKTYATYIKKWFLFTQLIHVDPMKPSLSNFISFLTSLYNSKLQYSTIGTARSAVNQFLKICTGIDFSESVVVSKFMKGIFELRPSLPKYSKIWDVNTVLTYISRLTDHLPLSILSGKLCVLFLLLSAQRGQTIHLVEIQDISFGSNDIQIATNHLIKQSRPGYHLAPITFKQYDKDPKLCIVRTFREYLDRTAALRGKVKKMLVTTQKPHSAASRDTVSRWVKSLLTSAGVDKCFKPTVYALPLYQRLKRKVLN
ncbi:uncharacterized protein LOC128234620 [Mya arenaria]|uniref:uncharacterized protein LOC128234620 n=1 Tax=Mya arenaria TaxID=6604 RepID=UPI0022E4B85C|nr:uncharacterized protein LOC128234620 [Mya arenaria]